MTTTQQQQTETTNIPSDAIRGWHFTHGRLRNGDPVPEPGLVLSHDGPIKPCWRGLHASEDSFDALMYAPGTTLHRVSLWGDMQAHGSPVDKYVGRHRVIHYSLDVGGEMRTFARECAIRAVVSYLKPEDCEQDGDWHVIVAYLASGDDDLRYAARIAALAAAWGAARYAAWAAADAAQDAADAVWAAARGAARNAVWAAADAAQDAADAVWAAARGAARNAARIAALAAVRDAALAAERDWQRGLWHRIIQERLNAEGLEA